MKELKDTWSLLLSVVLPIGAFGIFLGFIIFVIRVLIWFWHWLGVIM